MFLPVASTIWLLLATPFYQAPAEKEEQVKEEITRLQGRWQVQSHEEDGKKLNADELKSLNVVFADANLLVLRNTTLVYLCKLKVDPAKTPKSANATVLVGEQKGDTFLGIYTVDGDTLTICYDPQGNDRPKEFKAGSGSGLVLVVCKRFRAKGEERELSGKYQSETTMLGGKRLVLDVAITRIGEAYLLIYTKNNKPAFVGIGLRKGDIFCVSWQQGDSTGITLYQIEKDGKLVGEFTGLGNAGLLGTEVLTRVMKSI